MAESKRTAMLSVFFWLRLRASSAPAVQARTRGRLDGNGGLAKGQDSW